MRLPISVGLLSLGFLGLLAGVSAAQEPPPATPPAAPTDPAVPVVAPAPAVEPAAAPPAPPPAANPAPPAAPPAPSTAPPEAGDTEAEGGPVAPRDPNLPRLDVYFPEGDLDLRFNRLVNKVFYEGQMKYNFIKGDITAFLRYRYYGYKRTTQFTVFDSIEFAEVKNFSNDFDRVRGGLFLWQWPHTYNYRTYALVELDRISSNTEVVNLTTGNPIPGTLVRSGRTNNFVRLGAQFGTPDDARSNALVGETRARNERLFTAAQDIGPGGAGFTGAATYSFDKLGGNFQYVKLEIEALKRFDFSTRTFLIGRLSGGTFAQKRAIPNADPRLPEVDRFSIPRNEYFALDGRENLKGVGDKISGTEKVITTWELFFPWFLGQHRKFLRAEWQSWYWVLYGGYGSVGFDRKVLSDFSAYVPDVGLGFESSLRVLKYRFFLSAIVARALKDSGGVEARFSVKSYH